MSLESARAFLQKLKNDVEFKKSFAAAPSGEARLKMLKAAGFDFTHQHLQDAAEELTPEELIKVAGGRGRESLAGLEQRQSPSPDALLAKQLDQIGGQADPGGE